MYRSWTGCNVNYFLCASWKQYDTRQLNWEIKQKFFNFFIYLNYSFFLVKQ